MRLIICGSRSFQDFRLLNMKMNHFTARLDLEKLTVLSGHAEGADRLGERWCFENMVKYEIHKPDYKHHGQVAPSIRNIMMVNDADALIAFWDGKSPGTKHIIEAAKSRKLKVKIVRF